MKKSIMGFSGWVSIMVAVALSAMQAVATTHVYTQGGTNGYPAIYGGRAFLVERTLDFSASSITGTAADVYQVIQVPANSWVQGVGYFVTTGEDSGSTIDIGDGSDLTGYFSNANVTNGTTTDAAWSWFTLTTTAHLVVTGVTQVANAQLVITNVAQTAYNSHGTSIVGSVTARYGTNVSVRTLTLRTENAYPIQTTRAYGNGKLYQTADTIDLRVDSNCDTLKITVRALMFPVGGL